MKAWAKSNQWKTIDGYTITEESKGAKKRYNLDGPDGSFIGRYLSLGGAEYAIDTREAYKA
jgi:hypothetical protein